MQPSLYLPATRASVEAYFVISGLTPTLADPDVGLGKMLDGSPRRCYAPHVEDFVPRQLARREWSQMKPRHSSPLKMWHSRPRL